MSVIYLDNNATTKTAPEVFEAMRPFLTDLYGNPSSMHTFGGQIHRKIEDARAQVAGLINADSSEIIFTSCGTESDNTALINAIETNPRKKHIITTRVEHPAVLNFCHHLGRKGFRISYLPVGSKGDLDPDLLMNSVDDETALVSVMYANNETGVIFPIEEIAEALSDRGIMFHTDAVQAVGKIPVDVKKTRIGMLSLSGHKIHAPKGIGALYVRKGTRFHPYIIGGHQEHGRRAGTENVASVIGLGKAAELALNHLEEEMTSVSRLRDRLEQGLLASCPNAGVNGDTQHRLPNTTNISFEYIEGEAILLRLDEYGICASSGSACSSGSLEPSHVLRAMGIAYIAVHGSIRFSLSRYTTADEIERVIDIMPGIVKELRELSPFGRDRLTCRKQG
ncbi:MAG: cysteine desulfurase NifS [Thermodesulfovibrionales bacterium]